VRIQTIFQSILHDHSDELNRHAARCRFGGCCMLRNVSVRCIGHLVLMNVTASVDVSFRAVFGE
jgi:hypothetical protein